MPGEYVQRTPEEIKAQCVRAALANGHTPDEPAGGPSKPNGACKPQPNPEFRAKLEARAAEKLRAVRWLTAKGFSVIPIERGTKRPAFEWKSYQTTRPTEEEQARWHRYGDYDLAIVTGAVSGVVVVDIEGGALQRQPEAISQITTLTATTPSGGRHFFFRHPGTEVRNRPLRDAEGHLGDIRGDGGYVVAPPAPGREWEDPLADIAELPAELSSSEGPSGDRQSAGDRAGGESYADTPWRWGMDVDAFKYRPQGDRHSELLRLAKVARNAGVPKAEALRELMNACKANGLWEDGEAQLRRTFEDGWSYGAAPRSVHRGKRPARPIEILSWDEAAADVPERWVVEGLIPWGVSVLGGLWKGFKTFVAVHALHKAALAGKRVLYICAEGRGGFGKRMRGWMQVHGKDLTPEQKQAIKDNFEVIYRRVAFTEEQAVAQLSQALREHKEFRPDVIVVDTLARCFGGADENSTKDMNRFVAGCDDLREPLDCAIVIVHHFGKDVARGLRGATPLSGAADMISAVTKSTCKRFAWWRCTDMKDYAEFKDQYFRMEKVTVLGKDTLVAVPIDLIEMPADVKWSRGDSDKPKVCKSPRLFTAALKKVADGQPLKEWQASFSADNKGKQERKRHKAALTDAGWKVEDGRWVAPDAGEGGPEEV